MKTVIIGLGNTVLSDDGVGVYVARELKGRFPDGVMIIEAETAGLDLMEMLNGHDRAVIVDAIKLDGEDPGTVFRLKPDDLKITPRLASCHDIDIVTALALGRKLGLEMPDDVTVYAIQGEDLLTLHEGCLEIVSEVIPKVADEVESLIAGDGSYRISIDLEQRKSADA